jgi:Protein of unknown function (DUF3667)
MNEPAAAATPADPAPVALIPAAPIAAAPVETAAPQAQCANCSSPLYGPYCYHCGQPVKGLIRQLAGIMHDFFDTVLNLDSRVFRSLAPLYFRPGFLTVEYFAGRRVRYVTPFRLFFFLCVIAFFGVQLQLKYAGFEKDLKINNHQVGIAVTDDISEATTAEEVIRRRDAVLSELAKSSEWGSLPASSVKKIRKGEDKARARAESRLAYLRSVEEAKAQGRPVPVDNENDLTFDGSPFDPKNPIHVDWLPERGNDALNEAAKRVRDNLQRAKTEPGRLVNGLFGVLPQALFILMPMFAVLLKIVYLFKRRLYMEHLIVALHSHAFICQSMLLLALLGMVRTASGADHPGIVRPLGWAIMAAACWIPLYLLLMQKRVYRQGWIMTFLKYGFIGTCYTVLIAFLIAFALFVSLIITT